MQRLTAALFIVVGLINFAPIGGLLSAELLANSYGITAPHGDLLILLRHRALLFGIVGGLLIVAASLALERACRVRDEGSQNLG